MSFFDGDTQTDRFKKTAQLMESLVDQMDLPYLEVLAFQGTRQVFHKTIKPADCDGRDKLLMFSCTKPVTAVCAMQLVERGVISLEDKLVDYVPAFAESYFVDENGQKQVVGGDITLRHLLTMSAGLDYNLMRKPEVLELLQRCPDANTEQMVDAIAKSPLKFRPGERFLYSLCHDVLARVIEVVSGTKFSEYVKENVFVPLGMRDSGFRMDDPDRMLPLFTGEKGFVEPKECNNTYLVPTTEYDSGGAGMISTAADYAMFAVALANGGVGANGNRIISRESIDRMHQVEISVNDLKCEFTCVQGKDYSYGLGVRTRTRPTEWGLSVGEFGWDGAAGSYLMVDPVRNISVVIGMHLAGWTAMFMDKHLELVKQIYEEFPAGNDSV
ncbi:MAG: beta-lactamase family protein [Ruminococcaceae bacterium]|nr:beta-lactamase family protein [Oscillospiraceae bacterium]